MSIWVFFRWSKASFLVYSGGGYPNILFLGAWHNLEERGAHCKKRLNLFGSLDLHRSSWDFTSYLVLARSIIPDILVVVGCFYRWGINLGDSVNQRGANQLRVCSIGGEKLHPSAWNFVRRILVAGSTFQEGFGVFRSQEEEGWNLGVFQKPR